MKRIPFRSRLSVRLFICYTIPMLLLLCAYIMFAALSYRQQFRRELTDYRTELCNTELDAMESEIRQMDNMLTAVYQSMDELDAILAGQTVHGYYEGVSSMQRRFATLLYLTPRSECFALFSTEGKLLVSSGMDNAYYKSDAEMPWEEAFSGKYLVSVGEIPALAIEEPCLAVYRTVRTSPGQDVAVAMLYEDMDDMSVSFRDLAKNEEDMVIVTDGAGNRIYESPNAPELPEGAKTGEMVRFGNRTYLYITSRNSRLDWTAHLFCSAEQSPGIEEMLRSYNVGTFLLLIMVSAVISLLISRSIIRPITALTGKMASLGKGQFTKMENVPRRGEMEIICSTYNQMTDSIAQLIHEKYELESRRLQAELEALQRQINPHFLFNSLNSIKSLFVLRNSEEGENMVQALADILRMSMRKGVQMISLREELTILSRYLYLQEFRYGDRFSVRYETEEEAMEGSVPCLTLQPIAENIFKHAIRGTPHTDVVIRASKEGELLLLSVENTGAPIPEKELMRLNDLLDHPESVPDEHIGLANLYRRLYLCFGIQSGIRIASDNDSTVVTVTVPFRRILTEKEHREI